MPVDNNPISGTYREFDLTPNPRILAMLGEITLLQWRCIAELIDNSIDAFLNCQRAGKPVGFPQVFVSLPLADSENARISIRDNGVGMDAETLQNAVRAGWTGNAPFDNLGFYGMGLKIAMARLGTVTTVWTTRQGDPEWIGIEINFAELQRQGHFKTPRLTRPKNDPNGQGTEIIIERLKPEQREWFAKNVNRSNINKQLSNVYSSMLRKNGTPLTFELHVGNKKLEGHNHCIWGGEDSSRREVTTARYGTINACQNVDVRLGERPYCQNCFQWLSSTDTSCATCGSADGVIKRERRVYGWLGIQRYLDTSEYGLDFIRHGRKIEIANKDLFKWVDDQTQEEEYPIDDPRHRGRIVGEIHLDHSRVTYTKDRFDRNDPGWEEMTRIVRGEGPLRPERAEQLGYGQNVSPLFLLFQAFRRSNPHKVVAGAYSRLLVVPDNNRAQEMAEHFYAGEAEYQTDQKWWDLVEEADRNLLVSNTTATPGTGGGVQIGIQPVSTSATATVTPPPSRQTIPSLTREYRDDATGIKWKVAAYVALPADPELADNSPWRLKARADGVHEFIVNTGSEVFQSATMTPLDGLLVEFACAAMDFQRGNPASSSLSKILLGLRNKYAGTSKLDPVQLAGTANEALTEIACSIAKHIKADGSRALFEELPTSEREAILHRMATRSIPNHQKVIGEGYFLDFAPPKTLLRFFENHPELFFDGKNWNEAYSSLDYETAAATEEARAQLVRYYSGLLTDAIWLAERDVADLRDAPRAKLLRAAMALELLTKDTQPES